MSTFDGTIGNCTADEFEMASNHNIFEMIPMSHLFRLAKVYQSKGSMGQIQNFLGLDTSVEYFSFF